MVQVGPIAGDFVDGAEKPLQQIELMWRLIDEDAATLGGPFAAPWIGAVIGFVAPAQARKRAQHRAADFSGIDCRLHALHRLKQPPLADYAEFDIGSRGAFDHRVAGGEGRSEWLFDE